jgi:branched-chain amino acid transport system substrate-binding protein
VAESVTIPGEVVLVSPSATSPAITDLADDDYVFRTSPSDAMQGKTLAGVAAEQGFATACTMFMNDAYGSGLSTVFTDAFEALDGSVLAAVPHEFGKPTYLPELEACTADSPDVLVAITYPENGETLLIEAVQNELADNFLLSDGLKSQDLVDSIEAAAGVGVLDGTYGTALAGLPSPDFDAQYEAEYGEPPPDFTGETYSAVAALALAAAAADSTDSTAIRDALRDVVNRPGVPLGAGSAAIAEALALAEAGEDINFLGYSVLDLGFDANGDPIAAAIEIWTIEGGEIQTVRTEFVGDVAISALFADVDCDGDVSIGDALKIARFLIGLPVSQEPWCAEIGETVHVDGADIDEAERVWGDVDCDGDVSIGDALKAARFLIGLPVSQEPGCPPIGETVYVH